LQSPHRPATIAEIDAQQIDRGLVKNVQDRALHAPSRIPRRRRNTAALANLVVTPDGRSTGRAIDESYAHLSSIDGLSLNEATPTALDHR
jgi:hypothetical protein